MVPVCIRGSCQRGTASEATEERNVFQMHTKARLSDFQAVFCRYGRCIVSTTKGREASNDVEDVRLFAPFPIGFHYTSV